MGQIQLRLQRLDEDGAHLYEPDEQLQLLFGETKEELLPRMESIIDERGLPSDAQSEYDEEVRSWMKHALHSKEYYERATFMGLAIEIVEGEWQYFADVLCGEEFLYAAQMILDDIADGQTERHGRPTVNAAIGVEKSIAVAQMLASLGFNCIQSGSADAGPETQSAVVEKAHSMMQEIFYAQYLDEALAEKPLSETTREDYDNFLGHTTPVDIAFCFESGARLGGGSEDEIDHLRKIGSKLGNIIQVRDDFLDYAKPGKADKKTNIDIKSGKKRLPIILAYENVGNEDMKILSQVCKQSFSSADVQYVTEKVITNRVLDEARNIIDIDRQSVIKLLESFSQTNNQIYQIKKLLSSIRL